MTRLLLVGEDTVLLDIVLRVLVQDGYEAHRALDHVSLREQIIDTDIVIFEHVEPTDVYRLNPRSLGYRGPMILLAEFESRAAQDLIGADRLLLKPFLLQDMRHMIEDLAGTRQEG